jgi:two-component system LytT family response regulator
MIVDDERDARERLAGLVNSFPELSLVAVAASVCEAATLFVQHQPNIVLLDIEMSAASGFDLLPSLVPVPKIIFITAYQEFAIRAFEVNAVDYLLKPVFRERFSRSLNRIIRPDSASAAGDDDTPVVPFQRDDLIFFRGERASLAIPTKSIICITAAGNFSQVVAEDQESLVYRNLSQWEQRLPTNLFVRVDRSFIVNLTRITKIVALDRDHTEVHLDCVAKPRTIGRSAAHRLMLSLKQGIS